MDKISAYSIHTRPSLRGPSNGKPPRTPLLNRKRLTWIGIVVLVLALGASAAWGMRWYNQRKLIASIKDNPRQAFEAVREGKISREDAWQIMQESFEQRMNQNLDGYFALPPGKERTAYLDKLIDEQQAQMRDRQQRAATQPAFRERPTTRPTTRPDRERGGDPVARMRNRIETGNPARRSQQAEFRSAMRQRMAERGITPGRGGFGGGWGGRGGGGGGGRGGGGNR